MSKKPKRRRLEEKSSRTLAALLQQIAGRSASGDAGSIETLWDTFNWLAGLLAVLTDKSKSATRHQKLANVLNRCQHILKVALRHDDCGALNITLAMTVEGCDVLRQTADHNLQFVRTVAEREAFWPALVAGKKMYQLNVNKYVERLGVGTKSVPRTTHTKIEASDHWMELATMIVNDIVLYRTVLLGDKAKSRFPGAMGKAEQTMLAKAKRYPQILTLVKDGKPLPLHRDTKRAWWSIGLQMLKDYWRENPQRAASDLRIAGSSAHEPGSIYMIRKVRNAFYTLAK